VNYGDYKGSKFAQNGIKFLYLLLTRENRKFSGMARELNSKWNKKKNSTYPRWAYF